MKDLESGTLKSVWYLHSASGYEGPFTSFEIMQLINHHRIEATAKIWTERENIWKPVSSVPEFEKAFLSRPVERTPQADPGWMGGDEFWRQLREQNLFRSEAFSHLNEPQFNKENDIPVAPPPVSSLPRKGRASLAFGTGILVSMSVVLFLNRRFDDSPSFEEIPAVSKSENRELKAAVAESMTRVGPNAALALVENGPQDVAFVVGSNQPDGTRFNLKIRGVSETLVSAFRFSRQASLVLKGGIARSQTLLRDNGASLPAGEYDVSVSCETCAVTGTLAQKKYFLGDIHGAEYDLKLREFHEEMRSKARSELNEAKQLTETLERELLESSSKFTEIIAEPSKKKEAWNSFAQNWQKMHSQLTQMMNRWDGQNSRGEVFYSDLFSGLKQSLDLIRETHELQGAWVNASDEVSGELETRTASANSLAQSSLLAVRSKIKMLEHLPLSANGMPRTE